MVSHCDRFLTGEASEAPIVVRTVLQLLTSSAFRLCVLREHVLTRIEGRTGPTMHTPRFSRRETDEFGYKSVVGRVHLHDLQATMLHLLGVDHERLTFPHHGRDFRLTDVFGNVVREIFA